MRTTANPTQRRCVSALQLPAKATRCILVPGHGGPHEGRDTKRNPYNHHLWYQNDGRSFTTTKTNLYAWPHKKETA